MRLTNFLLVATAILSTPVAHADSFYTLVSYQCDKKNDRIVLSYAGGWNEDGEDLVDNKGKDAWEPSSLIDVGPDGDQYAKLNTVTRNCHLSDGSYQVKIGPKVFSYHVNGHCGALTALPAWVDISKNKKILVHQEFESSCDSYSDSDVVTDITYTAGAASAVMKIVKESEFHKF